MPRLFYHKDFEYGLLPCSFETVSRHETTKTFSMNYCVATLKKSYVIRWSYEQPGSGSSPEINVFACFVFSLHHDVVLYWSTILQ
jgi:hypothetical protein